MATKYHSFNIFMNEVISKVKEKVNPEIIFAIDNKIIGLLEEVYDVPIEVIEAVYINKQLPLAIKEAGETLYPRWKSVEGSKYDIDNLQQESVNVVIKIVFQKQTQLFEFISEDKTNYSRKQPETYSSLFEAKKTELLSLLDKSNAIADLISWTDYLAEIPSNLKEQIKTVRQRCHERLLSIALIGDFQSGKSTTLNTFADGREIAPRGLGGGGIKTSACCLVKVRNPNEEEEETVKVVWRREDDLLLRLDEALGETACSIPDSKLAEKLRKAEKYTQEYYSLINFKTSEGRALLEQALKKELEEYQKSQNKGSQNLRDQLDRLSFVMIVLAYYDDPTLKNLQQRDKFEPGEIENYLKFPNDFEKRWNKCFNNYSQNLTRQEFVLQEVMYAFIEEVTYVVTSENLQKSGAQIVDCPGLLASTYDTSVASNAMQEASAIWFLLSGDKQLSESDKIALSHILEIGCEEKVLFGFNYKKQLQKDDEGNFIAPVIKEILEQLKIFGFTASHQVKPLDFNAFLALRAMQGKKLLDNSLDQFSKHQIIKDAEAMIDDEDFNSVEKAWLESVIEVMSNIRLGKKELRKILSLEFNAETVKFVREKSQWDSATEQIKEYVYKREACSVLVNLGCQLINALKTFENFLSIVQSGTEKQIYEVEEELLNTKRELDFFKRKLYKARKELKNRYGYGQNSLFGSFLSAHLEADSIIHKSYEESFGISNLKHKIDLLEEKLEQQRRQKEKITKIVKYFVIHKIEPIKNEMNEFIASVENMGRRIYIE